MIRETRQNMNYDWIPGVKPYQRTSLNKKEKRLIETAGIEEVAVYHKFLKLAGNTTVR